MKITLSGDVGWEITPQAVREQLEKAGGQDIEITISSRGGLVGAALEIYNMIRNYPGHTTAVLSGYAMSAASYIPMACKKVIAEDNAVMMIHNAWGLAIGDHNEMKKVSGILGGLSSLLSGAYARFTGKDRATINKMMDDETWLFGEEIEAAGFAHATISAPEDDGVDQVSALAAAKHHIDMVYQRLAMASATVQSDLHRVAAMASGGVGNLGDSHQAQPQQSAKEPVMDLKTLKDKHPELVAAITDEATAVLDEKLAAAKAAGAEAERQRIADVRAQLIPGHEKLIDELAADGKSTGGDAAKAIVAAEKELRQNAAKVLDSDANPPAAKVKEPDNGAKAIKRAEFNALDQEQRRAHLKAGGIVVD